MGIFDKIRGEFVDIIEWTDTSSDTMVYRFERHDNEIKMGAKLTVREGQAAVFINEGRLADVFKPGMYALATENMPILSTLLGWKHGFSSPFKAEVYFVTTRRFTDRPRHPRPSNGRRERFRVPGAGAQQSTHARSPVRSPARRSVVGPTKSRACQASRCG